MNVPYARNWEAKKKGREVGGQEKARRLRERITGLNKQSQKSKKYQNNRELETAGLVRLKYKGISRRSERHRHSGM